MCIFIHTSGIGTMEPDGDTGGQPPDEKQQTETQHIRPPPKRTGREDKKNPGGQCRPDHSPYNPRFRFPHTETPTG